MLRAGLPQRALGGSPARGCRHRWQRHRGWAGLSNSGGWPLVQGLRARPFEQCLSHRSMHASANTHAHHRVAVGHQHQAHRAAQGLLGAPVSPTDIGPFRGLACPTSQQTQPHSSHCPPSSARTSPSHPTLKQPECGGHTQNHLLDGGPGTEESQKLYTRKAGAWGTTAGA